MMMKIETRQARGLSWSFDIARDAKLLNANSISYIVLPKMPISKEHVRSDTQFQMCHCHGFPEVKGSYRGAGKNRTIQ
jgi:hypothetical protein